MKKWICIGVLRLTVAIACLALTALPVFAENSSSDPTASISGEIGEVPPDREEPEDREILWPAASEINYGQVLSAAWLTGGSEEGVFYWEDWDLYPPVDNPGYKMKFVPRDPTAARPAERMMPVSVRPLSVTVLGASAVSRPYEKDNRSVEVQGGFLNGILLADEGKVWLEGEPVGEIESPDSGVQRIKVSGYRLAGPSAGNYLLSQPEGIQVAITGRELTLPEITVSKIGEQICTVGGARPEPAVRDGNVLLKKDVDYSISYAGNRSPEDSAVARIVGRGNYTGLREVDFTVSYGMAIAGAFNFPNGYDRSKQAWQREDITVTAGEGFRLASIPTGYFGDRLTFREESAGQEVLFYVLNERDGTISLMGFTYRLDKTRPVIRSIPRVAMEDGSTEWTILAEDAVSGLAEEAYSFDGGKSWQSDTSKRMEKGMVLSPGMLQVRDSAGNIAVFPN